jgi:glycolate oxidase
MLEPRIIKSLQEIVGARNVSTEKADLICYSYDATQQRFLPAVVVHPGTTAEIARIMQLANAERIPVFPRGAGSGFTGGSLPTKPGIVLTTERMDHILEIDEENLIAVVEPGVVTEQFQLAVEKVGLFYPPDPASLKFSALLAATSPNAPAVRAASSTASPRTTSSASRSSPRPAMSSPPAARP